MEGPAGGTKESPAAAASRDQAAKEGLLFVPRAGRPGFFRTAERALILHWAGAVAAPAGRLLLSGRATHIRCALGRLLFRFCPSLLALALGAGLLAGCAREPYGTADARPPAEAARPLPPGADSVRGAAAGRQYDRHGALYRRLLGAHYRRVWAAPVAAPVLDPARAAAGGPLRPRKAGGGYQSISLNLEGPGGRLYALRALDKDPRKTLPVWLRHSFLLSAVRDATSAANPYAALVVPPLAQAVGVRHGTPRLVYVRPDEAGLGETSARFRGRLALLEEKPDGRAQAVLNTEAMLARCAEGPANAVDAPGYLRARLLDLWLGDWDRHGKQWGWAAVPAPGGGTRFEPVPKDRDQVFFRFNDGALPRVVSWLVPKLQTFGPRFGNVRGLARQGRFLDRRALAPADRAAFARAAAALQGALPDSLLARAVHRLPPAVFALEGPRTLAALRARRAALPDAAARYYRALARRPAVRGTAQAERFVVRRYPDSVAVAVYAAAGPPGAPPFYRRTFGPADTRALTLDGRGGADVFDVGTAPGRVARLRLTLLGPPGPARPTTTGPRRRLFYQAAAARAAAGHPLAPPGPAAR